MSGRDRAQLSIGLLDAGPFGIRRPCQSHDMILQQADTEFESQSWPTWPLLGSVRLMEPKPSALDHNAGFCTPQPDATGDDRMLCLGVSAPPAASHSR